MRLRSSTLVGLALLAAIAALPARAEPVKAGSTVTLDERAAVIVPQGVVAYIGPDAARESEARGQAPGANLALYGTDIGAKDPIVVTIRWVPARFAPVEAAPTADEARAAINREIAAEKPRIGSAGTGTQFSEWLEQPTLDADTKMVRQSYSVETNHEGRTGTGFSYRATAYGRAGSYEIAVTSSADRALVTPAIYGKVVETFHFLPGETYADGVEALKNAPPPPEPERNYVKFYVFIAALLLVVAVVGGLFWLMVWPRLRDEH